MKVVQIIAASAGLILLVSSGISQLQVLFGAHGFIEQQQGWVAILGGFLVVVSFVAISFQKSRTTS